MLIGAFTCISFAQDEMTKEEWQKQITDLTAQSAALKAKLDGLQKEVEDLQKQDGEKACVETVFR